MDKIDENPKKRIFDAALVLFAHKGFAAVRTREIAEKAGVNIAMLNYYFGGKLGVLRAIINESYEKFYQAITDVANKDAPREERVRCLVKNLVDFYRSNRELAMVGFNTLPIDIPEMLDLKMTWITEYRARLDKFFNQLGLDIHDTVKMSFMRGILCAILSSHFNMRFMYEHIACVTGESKKQPKKTTPEVDLKYDDAYYKRFGELLSAFYLNGLNSVIDKG
ncbi:MAG: TetR/AcrR family transcriptional regulator [candidate division WOR-3 bacterium]|nr:MAG: TetR/AcrR family transcriptional regulator [candidate division WOR-3 bacterium]